MLSLTFYYEKEELLNTPSFKNGIDSETESRYRTEGVKFIIDIGKKINLGYNTIATAVVFFQRFYMVHSFKEYPRCITACSCLFLAGKTQETPKRSNDLLKAAREIISNNKVFENKFGNNPQRELIKFESVLMHTIDFQFEVEHPYKYILKYAKYLKGDKTKLQNVVQMAWNFMNDSLRTTLCIQWEPEVVAISLLYLSTKLCGFEVVNWKGKKPKHQKWWDLFIEDFEIGVLEDVCNQILDLYSEAKPPSTLDSPLSISSNEMEMNKGTISSTSSSGDSTPNTFSDQREFSNGSNVVYLPGLPPVDLSVPPPPVNFFGPPSYHPASLPPNFGIPPPALSTCIPSCFTVTPESPFFNQFYYPYQH